jgi:hypothetical protein
MVQYAGGSPQNYTVGGTRFWFNRLVDDSLSPARYEGFRDMGNVVDSSLEQAIEELEHFSSKSGTRRRDRSITTQIEEDITFTLDELNVENLREFFRGGDLTNVLAADGDASDWLATTAYALGDWVVPTARNGFIYKCTTAGTSDGSEPSPWSTTVGGTESDATVVWTVFTLAAIANEVMSLVGEETRILGFGYQAASVVVSDITGVTPFTLTTDYLIVDVIGGYKGIQRVDGGGITDGEFVSVDYDYETLANKMFSPATVLEVKGQAMFFGVSDTGNEFKRSFRTTQLQPEGAMELDDEDWTTFDLDLKILDDTDVTPAAPFGLFHHFGVGQDT